MREFLAADGDYIDVHAWQFTPESFRLITQTLFDLGFIDMKPYRVYATPRPRNEFTAVLTKCAPQDCDLGHRLLQKSATV